MDKKVTVQFHVFPFYRLTVLHFSSMFIYFPFLNCLILWFIPQLNLSHIYTLLWWLTPVLCLPCVGYWLSPIARFRWLYLPPFPGMWSLIQGLFENTRLSLFLSCLSMFKCIKNYHHFTGISSHFVTSTAVVLYVNRYFNIHLQLHNLFSSSQHKVLGVNYCDLFLLRHLLWNRLLDFD